MGKNCCRLKCWKIGLLVVAGIAALGWVVMALWNWLVPTLFFGGKEIGYLQAIGLLLLCRILFGGFRGHGCRGRWHRHGLEQMTPEQREKFQAGMRGCCGDRTRQDDAAASKEQNG